MKEQLATRISQQDKISLFKKLFNCMYYGDYFAKYTTIKSLHFTSETNTILCQLHLNLKKKK